MSIIVPVVLPPWNLIPILVFAAALLSFTNTFVEGPEWLPGIFGVGYDTAPLGGGSHDLIETFLPEPAHSVYTRSTFDIVDKSQVFSLFLGADHDDGIVAWVPTSPSMASSSSRSM